MTKTLFNRNAIIDWWLWWLAIETTGLSFHNAFATDEALLRNAKPIGVTKPCLDFPNSTPHPALSSFGEERENFFVGR
ncbi:MAG: hypothetical protein WCH99_11035 [Verrucomicrobiota bacterium]